MSVGSSTAGWADLHVHSTASDGTQTPADVVREAAACGLKGLSLTDHDTVDGLAAAAATARGLGLVFLPGAELSANEPGTSIHLLAYGFDTKDPSLLDFMAVYRADRLRRARDIVHRFNGLGVPLVYESVEREAGPAAPTRAHVARALVREALIPTQREVFGRYLARGKPAFVEKRPTPPARVIELVHDAGGVVLLAHPGHTHTVDDVRRWVADGLDGVEVIHPSNSPDVRQRMSDLVRELRLLRSGGSDWHGPGTHRSGLGAEEVPLGWLYEIAERCSPGIATGARSLSGTEPANPTTREPPGVT